ncbi:MAG: NRDE family protein [Proteobacteria bacterium]|nr:NRDE family protein [Pseudomonadota bacterium]
MCLVAIALDRSRRFPLVIAANRDELHARPATRLAWWTPLTDAPSILSGRDVESGGTWMGLTAHGRLALVTNVREPARHDPDAPSRGSIVPDWLSGREPMDRFWMRSALSGYNGFNLIAADLREGVCFWASNRSDHPRRLEPGIHGLSNAGLDTPWPKVTALKTSLAGAIDGDPTLEGLIAALFDALADRHVADDAELPHTGIPPERERLLAPAFIHTPDGRYGTRCSTVLVTERSGRRSTTHVIERSFDAAGLAVLQRRALLRDWPPRGPDEVAGQGTVSESGAGDAPLRASASHPGAAQAV